MAGSTRAAASNNAAHAQESGAVPTPPNYNMVALSLGEEDAQSVMASVAAAMAGQDAAEGARMGPAVQAAEDEERVIAQEERLLQENEREEVEDRSNVDSVARAE